MTVHVLHAGDGYTYLTRQVASHDVQRGRGDELVDYYTVEGNPPGAWRGRGISALGVDGVVSEAQMKALFGEGLHPDAEAIIAARVADGVAPDKAVQSARLGRPFPQYSTDKSQGWRQAVAREGDATAAMLGIEASQLTAQQRDHVRLRAGAGLFVAEAGREPVDEPELRQFISRRSKQTPQPVAGYDLVFTPVKSVSVLWALGDEDTRVAVEEAHEAAVDRAVAFLEDEAAFTRTGRQGVAQVDTRGLVIAAFDHRDSRGGDPNLHTHCAVANRVQTAEGKWLSLDGRMIHRAGVAASETYNTAVEDELAARLGVTFVDVARGDGKRPVREIAGVDRELIEGFSGRREAITGRYEQLLADWRHRYGKTAPKHVQYRLAQQATLETREGKTELRSLAELRSEWFERAVAMVGPQAAGAVAERATRQAPERSRAADVDVAATAAAVIVAVSGERSRWRRTHLQAEAQRQLRGVGLADSSQREQLVVSVVEAAAGASVELSAPQMDEVPAQLQRADGSSVFGMHQGAWMTSSGVLDAEARLMAAAEQTLPPVVEQPVFEASLAVFEETSGRRLDAGQRALAGRFACSPRSVDAGIGPAGAGKTTAMAAVAYGVQGVGRRVIALAPSASAATLLGEEISADDSDTLDAIIARSQSDETASGIGAGDLVIVDEASMASTANLDALVGLAERRQAHVRLLGDHMQLSAVQAGGAFRLLADTTGAIELAELHRFASEGEAAATEKLRVGDETSLDFYETHERIHTGTREALIEQVYGAWSADMRAGRESVMMAADRDTVAELNARAHLERMTSGQVGETGMRLRDGSDAGIGDVIVTRRNDRRLTIGASDYVKNGDRWTIESHHTDGSVTARNRGHQAVVVLPADYMAAHVELGYASTVHSAQGTTVEAGHVIADASMSRESLYVALTRGRQANHAYAPTDQIVDPDMHTPGGQTVTGRDVLAGILAHSQADMSAHQTIAEEYESAGSLARLIPEYEHGLGIYGHDHMIEVLHSQVPEHTEAIAVDPAWPALSARLDHIAAGGGDPAASLARAAGWQELDSAHSVAQVLCWRLDQHAPTANKLIPEAPPAGDGALAHWLSQRHQQIDARAAYLSDQLTAERPAWLPTEANLDETDHRQLWADIAVYRDRYAITDVTTPLGYEPATDGQQHHQWQHLHDRLDHHGHTNTPAAAHGGLLTVLQRAQDRNRADHQPAERQTPTHHHDRQPEPETPHRDDLDR